MSVSLLLLPLSGKEVLKEKDMYCGTQLRLEDDYDLLGQISEIFGPGPDIDTYPIPEGATLSFYGENGLEETRTSGMGGLLYFAYAGDFRRVKVPGPASVNKAIMAYLSALPRNTPVFLYWC